MLGSDIIEHGLAWIPLSKFYKKGKKISIYSMGPKELG